MDLQRALALLETDILASIDAGFQGEVLSFAKERVVVIRGLDLQLQGDKLVEDVQQMIHDLRIDTAWPRCPLHSNHPMWLNDGYWCCHKAERGIIRLGELRRALDVEWEAT